MISRPVKLSKSVQRELSRLSGKPVVVAAVVSVPHEDIDRYAHLGVHLENGGIAAGEPAPPPRSCGPQARRNLDGWEDKRTDLEKETRDISTYAPSWHSSGYHLVSRTIEAWPVDHHPAKLLTISTGVLEVPADGRTSLRFRVDQPLHQDDPDFERDLAFNLRLLREAVGEAHVHSADFTDEDFASIQRVDWELLPRGAGEEVLKRLTAGVGATPAKLDVAAERIHLLDRLDHDGYIVGTGKFARYFGARFGSRLVALENLDYGNALYVFEGDWEALTQLSRSELIKRRDPSVHRIPHVRGWQSLVRQILRRDKRISQEDQLSDQTLFQIADRRL